MGNDLNMRGWQPIETAPKDGTPVLLTMAGAVLEADEDTHCDIGRWDVGFWGEENWCMNRGDYWHGATHWMPLPPPPLTTQEHQDQQL